MTDSCKCRSEPGHPCQCGESLFHAEMLKQEIQKRLMDNMRGKKLSLKERDGAITPAAIKDELSKIFNELLVVPSPEISVSAKNGHVSVNATFPATFFETTEYDLDEKAKYYGVFREPSESNESLYQRTIAVISSRGSE